MAKPDRRSFLRSAGTSAVAAAVTVYATESDGANPAERLRVGLIGPGGMGSNHLRQLAEQADVEIAYVCDVDAERLDAAARTAEDMTGHRPEGVRDLRRVLDDATVDAVWIATPDHWHAPATILALDAGKHVYVEKPCCHNVREGRLMIEAARRNDRVVQVGTQSRSAKHVLDAMERLRSGAIGEVLVSKAWNSQLRGNIGHAEPSAPPAALDFDLWLGPTPLAPYRKTLLHGIWRWWYDYGAGDIGNDGIHDLDLAWWGLGVETHPSRVVALGGKYFFVDDQQFPDTQQVVYEYPGENGGRTKQLIFEQRIWAPYKLHGYENGAAFYGTEGYLVLGHGLGYQLYGRKDELIESAEGSPQLLDHHRNFIDCIRSGARPAADIEIGHRSATLCHLGNIATRLGRALSFNPAREQFIDDVEADALLRRQYRDGHWAVPAGV